MAELEASLHLLLKFFSFFTGLVAFFHTVPISNLESYSYVVIQGMRGEVGRGKWQNKRRATRRTEGGREGGRGVHQLTVRR